MSASDTFPADGQRVYALLADYRAGHPRVLPKPHFQNMEVERGGVGEGTVVRFEMRVMGRTRSFRASISEPRPSRMLVERDLESGVVTTFLIESVGESSDCRVTINTQLKPRNGLAGNSRSVPRLPRLDPLTKSA